MGYALLSDPAGFRTIYEEYGYGSMLMFDEAASVLWSFSGQHGDDNEFIFRHVKNQAIMLNALFPSTKSIDKYAAWIAGTTKNGIE